MSIEKQFRKALRREKRMLGERLRVAQWAILRIEFLQPFWRLTPSKPLATLGR